MLVLTRKPGQSLVIDNSITVHIARVEGNRVKVGIEASSDVRVRRGELPPEGDARPVVEPNPAPLPPVRRELKPKTKRQRKQAR